MYQSSNLTTVAECDTAIAKVMEEKVSYDNRKQSITKQLPNLEGAQDVASMIANLQADIASIDQAVLTATDPDFKVSLMKRKNNYENKIMDLEKRGEISVLATKVEKHLDLVVVEAGIVATTAALEAYQTRRAELLAA